MARRTPLTTLSALLGVAGGIAAAGAGIALRWGTQPVLDRNGRWDEEGSWHDDPEATRLLDDLWSTNRIALGGAALLAAALACTRCADASPRDRQGGTSRPEATVRRSERRRHS